ncbi:hypothetical protein K470DRAFT_107843 [Piedraia hortae CBS 480.64]|uniref:Uncharacterized protein n=1 Tax=Piedraia hortae CBS 480.64 TaxID=1314780 RepID=A0A6A7BVJ2_9PEZI|nr:hypothetical protein K470DRAFT_107843 [Piedraia hortae CBS 480.64]
MPPQSTASSQMHQRCSPTDSASGLSLTIASGSALGSPSHSASSLFSCIASESASGLFSGSLCHTNFDVAEHLLVSHYRKTEGPLKFQLPLE